MKIKLMGSRNFFEGGRKEYEKKVYSKLPNLNPTILTIVNTLFIIYVIILISVLINEIRASPL